jgi:uncharacterized membrane protein YkvA (DUF1232 family)
MKKQNLNKFRSYFSPVKLFEKVKGLFNHLGVQFIYTVLLMYFAFRDKGTPLWAKKIIIGVLGYFIAPIDAIPDLTPLVGYTDDLGLLSFGLVAIASYINSDVKQKARAKIYTIFNSVSEQDLIKVDQKL